MRLKIANIGRVGMISDLPAYDLPVAAITDAVNVAFRDGAITRSPGLTRAHDITGKAVWMEAWYSRGNGRSIVVSEVLDASKIYEIVGGVVSDVSPAAAIAAGYRWDSCVFGTTSILNNGSDVPFARSITDTGDITSLPNWPATWRAEIVRPFRNFLVAMKITEGGNPLDDTRVAWSNAAATNAVPPDWDGLDPASLAGGTSLAGDSGPIQDAATLGQSLIIYTQTACQAMTLTGGQFIMGFRPLFNRGLLTRRCVIPFDAFHFCIGNGVIYVHDGSSIQYPAEEKVQTKFFSELDDPEQIRLSHDASRRTIEIAYTTSPEDDLPTRALTWNYATNAWRFEDYSPFKVIRGLFVPDSVRVTTWDTTDAEFGAGVSWNDMSLSWNDLDVAAGNLSFQQLVNLPGGNSAIFRRENVQLRDGQGFVSSAAREKIDFNELLPQEALPLLTEEVKHINRIVPQVMGSGKIYFQFGTAMSPGEGTVWGPIVPFEIGQDWKVDFRVSGRYFAWKVYTTIEEPAAFRLSGFDLHINGAGSR